MSEQQFLLVIYTAKGKGSRRVGAWSSAPPSPSPLNSNSVKAWTEPSQFGNFGRFG